MMTFLLSRESSFTKNIIFSDGRGGEPQRTKTKALRAPVQTDEATYPGSDGGCDELNL